MRALARQAWRLAALTATAGLAAPAHAAGAGGGMPQLDPSGFVPQLVWLVITFVALYLVMARVALPRIAQVLEERQTRVAHDLDEAERLKAETEKAIADYEAALAKARASAQAVLGAARQELNAAAARARTDLDAQLAEQAKAAESRIAEAKRQALAGLGGLAAGVARDVVARLGGGAADEAAVQRAVGAALAGGR
jgi:F-type H+-transporting ATPase subunit b